MGTMLFGLLAVAAFFLFTAPEHELSITSIATKIQETVMEPIVEIDPNADIENQPHLSNPPEIVKAIYTTNWSAGSEKKLTYLFELLTTTELNAIVVDIKDYTGVVGYPNDIPSVKKYGAWEKRIPKINALIKRFHDAGIYVIGRIAVFQDGALVKARPDLAVRSSSTGAVWGDRKNVHWLDTASTEVWDYNIEIARDALARGFDEINFDYIRFPSDGVVSDIRYPFYDRAVPKRVVLKNFFTHLREQLPGAVISADLFGDVTYVKGDIGVGQALDDALLAFDYIAPMIYPSHFANGFHGNPNPANAPYDVIHHSMERAIIGAEAFRAALPTSTVMTMKFRPWLQDFDLGADYDATKVRAQIQALDDLSASSTLIAGWMLWSPSNIYTRDALREN